MSADWYATLISSRKGAVAGMIEEFDRLVQQQREKRSNESRWMRRNLGPIFEEYSQAERWHEFFEEVSLFKAFFEAIYGPRRHIRETYFARVCPTAERSYSIPREGLAFAQALSLQPELTIKSFKRGLSILPSYSWFLGFRFRLTTPYLSRDDVVLYVVDNPVRKDKVLKLPMVAPTSWKGALRAALRSKRGISCADEESADSMIVRLLGNVKEEDEKDSFRAGRLRFFPTFFGLIGQVVINPHDRESGAGEQPIYFECVPAGAEGLFTLLYVPFDVIGNPEREVRSEVAEDLRLVTEAIDAMFTEYGFGAKTSSGFGVAEGGFPPLEDQKYGGLIRIKNIGGYQVGGFKGLRKAAEALRSRLMPSQGEA